MEISSTHSLFVSITRKWNQYDYLDDSSWGDDRPCPITELYAFGTRPDDDEDEEDDEPGHEEAGKTAEYYDLTTNMWTRLPNMPETRFGHACVALPNGKIYLIGGVTANSTNPDAMLPLSSCLCFDIKTQTYSRLQDFPIPCACARLKAVLF